MSEDKDDLELDLCEIFQGTHFRFDAARQARVTSKSLLDDKFITEREFKAITKRIDKEFKFLKEKHGIEPWDGFKKDEDKEPVQLKGGLISEPESPFDYDERTPGRITNLQDI